MRVRGKAVRMALAAAVGLAGVWWLVTLLAPQEVGPVLVQGARAPLRLPAGAGDASDTLCLHLEAPAPALQQISANLVWRRGGAVASMPLEIAAWRGAQEVCAPAGLAPAWPPSDGQVLLRADTAQSLALDRARLLRRLPGALDVPLSRALLGALGVPPGRAGLLLCAALLCAAGAWLWPSPSPRRTLAALCAPAALAAALTMADQWAALRQVAPLWGLPERQTWAALNAYDRSPAVNALLLEAERRLPDGARVLALDEPGGYLLFRSRYVLYPREVVAARPLPDQLRGLLAERDALLTDRPLTAPPAPGWVRLAAAQPAELWAARDFPAREASPLEGAPLGLLAGLALVVLAGSAWVAVLAPGAPVSLRLALAWLLGVLLLAMLMLLLAALGLGWSRQTVGGGLALAALTPLLRHIRRRAAQPAARSDSARSRWPSVVGCRAGAKDEGRRTKRRRPARQPATPSPRLTGGRAVVGRWSSVVGRWSLVLLLIGQVAYAAVLAAGLPFADQDTWTHWAFSARAALIDGSPFAALLRHRDDLLHHPAYPPALPFLLSWGFVAQGGLAERAVKLVFPLTFAALLALVYQACRRRWPHGAALGWTVWVGSTPLLLDHAALGNADLLLAAALLAQALALLDWLDEQRSRALLLAAVLGALAAWLRVDGLALALLLLGAAGLARLRQAGLAAAAPALPAAGLLVLLYLPWPLTARALGLAHDSLGGGLAHLAAGLRVIAGELLLSPVNSAGGPLGGGFGLLWVAPLIGLPLIVRRLRHDPGALMLAAGVGGGILAYLLVYAARPYYSIDRYLLHLAPLGAALLARVCAPAGAQALSVTDHRLVSTVRERCVYGYHIARSALATAAGSGHPVGAPGSPGAGCGGLSRPGPDGAGVPVAADARTPADGRGAGRVQSGG